jgi:UDP:flavonoid glycosyltransferase YjiC (YdhE family)
MANILFVTWDGAGNLPPALGIAAELQGRGETVRFLGHEQQRSMIERAGIRFESYSHSYPSSSTRATWPRWVASFVALVNDRSLGRDLLASIQRESTDLVVIDCVLRTVLRAAEEADIRRAVLVHSFYYIGGFGSGPAGPISRLRGHAAMEPWGGADVGLIATLRSLDPDGHKTLHPRIRFTGPVWQGTPQPATQLSGEPRILVSLSSGWFPGQDKALQNILDALRSLQVRAVVTTGPAIRPDDLRVPVNAEVHSYLPHADVLPTVSIDRTRWPRNHNGCPVTRFADHRLTDGKVHGSGQDRPGA